MTIGYRRPKPLHQILFNIYSVQKNGEVEIPASLEKEVSDLEAVVAKFQVTSEKIDSLSHELTALNQLDASLQVRPKLPGI